MRAKTKGIIGAAIGGIICLVMAITMMSQGMPVANGLLMVPLGAIGGFGYAFGWPLGKRWLAKIAGVAVGTSLLVILFSRDRRSSFLWTFMLLFLVLGFTFGICYLPGIVIGIKAIRVESQYS